MTDETTNPEAAEKAEPTPQPGMKVLAQYVRDMSFENAMAQAGISGDVSPEIEVAVSLDAKKRPTEGQVEVAQKYRIRSKNKGTDQTLFLLELDYVGVFQLVNIPEAQMHPFMLIECPRMVFPFVRRIVSDITRDGGFPPLNLDTVDFLALYRQEAQRRVQAEAANKTPV